MAWRYAETTSALTLPERPRSRTSTGGVLFLPRETTNDNEISRNVISGNGIDGIAIQPEIDAGVGNNNRITDNIIGLSAAGSSAIPNGGASVEIGVQGQGTTIGNTISHNSIDANVGLGIDINSDNPIPGSPMLTAAQITGGNTHVTGNISSFANQTLTIEFFASPACDPSGSGEGRDFLGVVPANTNGAGNATFDATLPPVGEGKVITATATAADGSTSEFSTCLAVVGATPTPSPTPTPSQGLLGDANCDGRVDGEDIIAALSEFADVPPGACGDLADADCDGDIDPADALRILRFLGGAVMPQPPGCADIGAPV